MSATDFLCCSLLRPLIRFCFRAIYFSDACVFDKSCVVYLVVEIASYETSSLEASDRSSTRMVQRESGASFETKRWRTVFLFSLEPAVFLRHSCSPFDVERFNILCFFWPLWRLNLAYMNLAEGIFCEGCPLLTHSINYWRNEFRFEFKTESSKLTDDRVLSNDLQMSGCQ